MSSYPAGRVNTTLLQQVYLRIHNTTTSIFLHKLSFRDTKTEYGQRLMIEVLLLENLILAGLFFLFGVLSNEPW